MSRSLIKTSMILLALAGNSNAGSFTELLKEMKGFRAPYRVEYNGERYHSYPYINSDEEGVLNKLYLAVDSDDDIVRSSKADTIAYAGKFLDYAENSNYTQQLLDQAKQCEDIYITGQRGEFVLELTSTVSGMLVSLLLKNPSSLKANVVQESRKYFDEAYEYIGKMVFSELVDKFNSDMPKTDDDFRRAMYEKIREAGEDFETAAHKLDAISDENLVSFEDAEELERLIVDASTKSYGAALALTDYFENIYSFLVDQVAKPIGGGAGVPLDYFLNTYYQSEPEFFENVAVMKRIKEEEFGLEGMTVKTTRMNEIIDDL